MVGYYSDEELKTLGLGAIGDNVKISKTTTIYGRKNITIGNNVRIDNFCVIAMSGTAKLSIGSNVQISAFNFINGLANITLENFATTAPYVRLFSSTDDYSGEALTNATIPQKFIGTVSAPIYVRKHVIIGTGSTVMPGIELGTGTAVAAHSFVKNSTNEFDIIGGVPAKFLGKRSKKLLDLEREMNNDVS